MLFGCYIPGLVPPETAAISTYTLCTPYNHKPVYTNYNVTLFRSHIHRVHVCLAEPATFTLGRTTRIFYICYCNNTGVEHIYILKWVSTESWPWRRKFSHCSCGDMNPQAFDHKSGNNSVKKTSSLTKSSPACTWNVNTILYIYTCISIKLHDDHGLDLTSQGKP